MRKEEKIFWKTVRRIERRGIHIACQALSGLIGPIARATRCTRASVACSMVPFDPTTRHYVRFRVRRDGKGEGWGYPDEKSGPRPKWVNKTILKPRVVDPTAESPVSTLELCRESRHPVIHHGVSLTLRFRDARARARVL